MSKYQYCAAMIFYVNLDQKKYVTHEATMMTCRPMIWPSQNTRHRDFLYVARQLGLAQLSQASFSPTPSIMNCGFQ